jgi:hypothetical protein
MAVVFLAGTFFLLLVFSLTAAAMGARSFEPLLDL